MYLSSSSSSFAAMTATILTSTLHNSTSYTISIPPLPCLSRTACDAQLPPPPPMICLRGHSCRRQGRDLGSRSSLQPSLFAAGNRACLPLAGRVRSDAFRAGVVCTHHVLPTQPHPLQVQVQVPNQVQSHARVQNKVHVQIPDQVHILSFRSVHT